MFGIPLALFLVFVIYERFDDKEQKPRRPKIEIEIYKQPMVWNGGSLQIGYLFEDAMIYVDGESEEITYSNTYDTPDDGIRVFDSLYVEICKHHCDSLAPYRFTDKRNRVFECSHPGASITLKYSSYSEFSEVEIIYTIPQKLGHGIGEEWQQYLVID